MLSSRNHLCYQDHLSSRTRRRPRLSVVKCGQGILKIPKRRGYFFSHMICTLAYEWKSSHALEHKPRNSSFFFRCVSGLSIPKPNGPRRGSGPLPRGGVPISPSYSARGRLRPLPLLRPSPLTWLNGCLLGFAPLCVGGDGGVGGWLPL